MFCFKTREHEVNLLGRELSVCVCVCVLPAIIAGSIKADRIMSPQSKHICFTGLLLLEQFCSGH